MYQLYRNESKTLIKAFQYIRNRGGQADVAPLMRKALNLRGRPPKKIAEIARDILSEDNNFFEVDDCVWAYKFPPNFDKAHAESRYISVDIEATGGCPPVEKIMEIGAVKYHGSKAIDEFNHLVNPEKPIQPYVANMTGINDELLRNASSIETVMDGFMKFIKDHVLIIHDPFPDMSFIDEAAMKIYGGVVLNPVIDTLMIAKAKLGLHSGLSLEQIAKKLDIEQNGMHRALEDAKTAGEAFFILRQMNDLTT